MTERREIEVEALKYSYSGRGGICDVSFSAPRYRITALLGPNGSGKTTTLRCLVGQLDPEDGRIRFPSGSGKDDISFVEDRADLYPELTVAEHLTFWALANRIDGDVADRVNEALISVNLADEADSLGRNLSRGQRQRAVLAAHTMSGAGLLLLDEPTIALDPPGVAWLESWLRDSATRGACVLISSHDLDFVARLADCVVVLEAGYTVDTFLVGERDAGLRDRLLASYGDEVE